MNPLRTTLALFLTVLLPITAPAESPTTTTSGTLPLYGITLPNGETLYIFGSIHLLPPEAYPLPRAVEDAFEASSVVVMETDMAALESPQMVARILELGMFHDNTTLKTFLSPEAYEQYTAFLTEMGLPTLLFEKYKPWLVGITLSVQAMQKAGFRPEFGIEQHFARRAKALDKPMAHLEEPDFQIELLANLDEGQEEEYLLQTLDELHRIPAMMDEMVASWRNGQMDALAVIINESLEEHPAIAEKLLYARNRDWARQIDAMIREGMPAFIIVGAGHLAGKENLIDLLQASGHTFHQF